MLSDSTCVFNAELGKPDIERRKPVILLDQFTYCFSLQSSDYVIFDFSVDSASLQTSFKKCNAIMT